MNTGCLRGRLGALVGVCAGAAFAGTALGAGGWARVEKIPAAAEAKEPGVRPARFEAFEMNRAELSKILGAAPKEETGAPGAVVLVPMPDGTYARFEVWDSPVMAPELAAKFPEFKTYVGQGLDDRASTVRLDLMPQGFHAQVLSPEGAVYVDPYSKGDDTVHVSFWKKDYGRSTAPRCLTEDAGPVAGGAGHAGFGPRALLNLRTYRFACSCTGEFGAQAGGQAAALSAITTMTNRITGIYETDFGVRLSLVGNNANIIYISAALDPFTAPGTPGTTNTQNQTNLDSVIGSVNYDVGHVVHYVTSVASENGLAGGIGTVCGTIKGQGYTAVNGTSGDVLAVDYCAHELGHQHGGRHNFNNCGGGPGDSAVYANEPGSGSTIMGYAGICGTNDVQPHSDAYFNGINIDQVVAYTTGGGACGSVTGTANNPPTVSAGLNYTIPKSTPFALSAVGSDVDGDVLTYCWEEQDVGGAAVALPLTDNGSSPFARSRNPSTNPTRMMPQVANLLANTFDVGEILPTVGRTSTWRVTARDNHAGRGGTASATMTLTVNGTAGPFAVTSPNTAVSISAGLTTVTWNVAGTNVAPVNTANVKISLSTDGGNTFPTVLAASAPNTGSANVTLPNISTSTARIRVEAVGNIYFDVSNVNFTITPIVAGVAFAGTGVNTFSDVGGNGNANSIIDSGESSIKVYVQIVNNGLTTATGVTGTLGSLTPTVTVTGTSAAYANMATSVPTTNASPYVISVSPSHVCGNPINLHLAVNSAQGSGAYDFSLSTGAPGGPGSPQTFTYTGAAVPIPDNNATGASATLAVSGVIGTINDVNFKINGTSCNATAGSTTVGLDHTWVGDLVLTLTAPDSTSVIIGNRPGGTNNSGNNLCNTVLDDSGGSAFQSIAAAGNPWSATYSPANPLSAFNGHNPNGTWTFKVQDLAAADTGNIRSFSIIVTGQTPPTCTPPHACIADVDDGTFTGTPDGGVTLDDLLYFLFIFDSGLLAADVDDGSGTGTPDGGVTLDDLLYYLLRFDAGC